MTNRKAKDTMQSGDSKTLRIPITNADTGAPADLTGASARFGIFAEAGSTTALVSKSTAGGAITIVNVNATNDGLQLALLPADTAGLGNARGQAYYIEAEVVDAFGNVDTVMTGTLTIYADSLT